MKARRGKILCCWGGGGCSWSVIRQLPGKTCSRRRFSELHKIKGAGNGGRLPREEGHGPPKVQRLESSFREMAVVGDPEAALLGENQLLHWTCLGRGLALCGRSLLLLLHKLEELGDLASIPSEEEEEHSVNSRRLEARRVI